MNCQRNHIYRSINIHTAINVIDSLIRSFWEIGTRNVVVNTQHIFVARTVVCVCSRIRRLATANRQRVAFVFDCIKMFLESNIRSLLFIILCAHVRAKKSWGDAASLYSHPWDDALEIASPHVCCTKFRRCSPNRLGVGSGSQHLGESGPAPLGLGRGYSNLLWNTFLY